MGWSTREIAQLAGTTLRTVRHYHEIGLLDEPERLPNGYKAYRTEHLVRLLQIRRLTRLGFSLSMIVSMEDESEDLEETLIAVDAELAATITRLREARREIAEAAPSTGADRPPLRHLDRGDRGAAVTQRPVVVRRARPRHRR